MTHVKPLFLLLVACLLISVAGLPAVAQPDDTTSQRQAMDNILNEMEQQNQQSGGIPDSILKRPTAAQQQMLSDSTLAIYEDAMYAYYEYRVSGFEHRKEVFAWQLFSTKLTFWCVLFLVFSGICFSGIQFYKSLKAETAEGTCTGEGLLPSLKPLPRESK
ncbi:MAG: hypothetical protein U5K69_04650 [Balneolaceae bacterium]|nr:hypothetical protein [Balneolaceae bacterium]